MPSYSKLRNSRGWYNVRSTTLTATEYAVTIARRNYTHDEAQQVVDWLNGNDQPLTFKQPSTRDPGPFECYAAANRWAR